MISHEFRKAWFLVTVAAATVCAVIVTLPKFVEPKYMKTLRAEGFPTTREELNLFYPPVPDEENAAVLYRKAYALLPELTETEKQHLPYLGDFELGEPGAPLPQETLDTMSAYLDRSTEAYDVLKQAAQMPKCRFMDNLLDEMQFSEHYSNLRDLARVLSIQMFYASCRGDVRSATDSSETFVGVLQAIDQEPLLFSHLVAIAMYGIYSGALEEIFNRNVFPEDSLARMHAALEPLAADRPRVFRRILIGEMCYCLLHFDVPTFAQDIESISYDAYDPYLDIEKLDTAYLITSAIHAVLTPDFGKMALVHGFRKVVNASEALQNESNDVLAPHLDFPTGVRFGDVHLTLEVPIRAAFAERLHRSQLSLALAALASERFHRRNGVLPERLDDLVPDLLPEVPLDMNTGEPIRYVITDSGYELSAVWRISSDNSRPSANERRMTFTVSRPDLRKKTP